MLGGISPGDIGIGIDIHAHILLMPLFSEDHSIIQTLIRAYLFSLLSFFASSDEKSFLGMKMVNITPDFLIKKALLSPDIDFQQSLIRGVLRDGGFRETNGRFELLISHVFGQIFSKINILAQKCFLSEKVRCNVYHFQA